MCPVISADTQQRCSKIHEKNQEQLAAPVLPITLLNQHTFYRLALVLNRSIQRAREIGLPRRRIRADQHLPATVPATAASRTPRQVHRLQVRAAMEEGELMTLNTVQPLKSAQSPAVIKFNGRRLGFRVDTPLFASQRPCGNTHEQNFNSRDQHTITEVCSCFSSLSGNDFAIPQPRYIKSLSSDLGGYEDDLGTKTPLQCCHLLQNTRATSSADGTLRRPLIAARYHAHSSGRAFPDNGG